MSDFDKRAGEIAIDDDPALTADDGRVVFVGKISTPWEKRSDCPRNLVLARQTGKSATIELDQKWRAGLRGLEKFDHIIVLYWMHKARRDLIVQVPNHRPGPTGVFALRTPARPNPVALAVVRLLRVDESTGIIEIDAIDCLNGTPVIDIKPWFVSTDRPEDC